MPIKTTDRLPSVIKRFQLKQVRCTHSESRLSVRAGQLPKKTVINVANNLIPSRNERVLKCDVSCEVLASYEESDEPAITVRCRYQVVYECTTKSFPSQKVLNEHSDPIGAMGTLHAWPFIQHYVLWMTAQMGLPALALPLMAGTANQIAPVKS